MQKIVLAVVVVLSTLGALAETGRAQTSRIEENDSTITYSGGWYTNSTPANTQGAAALTNERGARATITFNGTGITWIGVADPWSGIASVYVDGTLYTVDTYAPSTMYQQPLFSVRGLDPASPHTVNIEVQHQRGPNAAGAWVWIDAFEVENGGGITGGTTVPAGRTEEQNPASIYTGTWFRNENGMHSGGAAALAIDPGSSMTVTFNGTGIIWLGYRDEWSGIARVILDGAVQPDVDMYASPATAQAPAFAVSGLAPGAHTLTIEVTGDRNPASAGSWIWIDAFDVQ